MSVQLDSALEGLGAVLALEVEHPRVPPQVDDVGPLVAQLGVAVLAHVGAVSCGRDLCGQLCLGKSLRLLLSETIDQGGS